jgi:hypothetical protein
MTLEEQIQNGIVPSSEEIPLETSQLTERQKQEFEAEVIYDWDHIRSENIRAKRAGSPEYNEALERVAADDYPGCPITASVDGSGNYVFSGTAEEVAPVVLEAEVIAPVAEPVVPLAPAVVTEDPNDPIVKVADGYEVRIDLGDGGGVQVFKGKTRAEVSRKLIKAQTNATREIRRRNREHQVLNESVDRTNLVSTEPIKPLSADEIYTLTEQLKDPATAVRAHQRLLEAQLGMPIHEFRSEWERQRQVSVAKRWVPSNPDFYNDPDGINAALVGRYFETHNIEVNEKNLGTVFNILKTKGALLEVPEIELPEPTNAPVAAVPAAAPVATVPAVVPTPAPAAPISKPVSAAPTVPVRVRPGSASTGLSPRQASVRPGASAGAVVGLTAEEYNKMPSSDVKRRYKTDLAFRSGVDKLITEGKI